MAGTIIDSWKKDGWTNWPYPSATRPLRTANQTPRWFPKDFSLSSEIMRSGPQNRSGGSDWDQIVKTADEKARAENFKF